jgi:hypothetical protein
VFEGTARQRNRGPQRWPDLLRQAQRSAAERLERAVGGGRFGPQAYLDWLMGQAAIAVLCAEAMDDLAGWHGREPGLRGAAQAWAIELRDMARLAAADMRAAGGVASPPRALVEEWSAFIAAAATSQRAGEALGAIALHSRLLPGCAGAALDALLAMPFARPASQYLARRRRPETDAVRIARDHLLDAYAGAALAAGAQRAATWSLDALAVTQTEFRD